MPRNRAWADTVINSAQILAEQELILNLLLDAPTVDTLTVVRMVIDVEVAHGFDEPPSDRTSAVSLGIGVTSVEAFNQGINALPEPQASAQYPPRGWLYVNTKLVGMQGDNNSIYRKAGVFVADLRSMRKVDKGVLYMVVHNNAILGSTPVDVWGRVRVLCLT